MEQFNLTSNSVMIKDGSATAEQAKKKRPARKKPENKTSKAPIETEDVVIISPNPQESMKNEVVEYALKLEFELLYTRKKLKKERKMFENLLKSLSLYFDCKEITPKMIDEYVQSVKNQLGAESEEEIEEILERNPTKKLHQEEISPLVGLVNTTAVPSGTGKVSERGAKGNSAKSQANLIKINLNEANTHQLEQPLASNAKGKGSKKNAKAEKVEKAEKEKADKTDLMTISKLESPKQKRKPAKKKNKGNEANKETDGASAPIIKEAHITMSGVKIGDLNQSTQIPMMPIEQNHIVSQHFLPPHMQHQMLLPQNGFPRGENDFASQFGMMIPNHIVNPMLKTFSPEELSRITEGILPQLGSKEDIYNYSKMFNGISNDVDKMYRNFMPSRSFDK